jgi:hypothetical protein
MKTNLGTLIAMVASMVHGYGQWIEWPLSSGGNGHSYLPVAVASPTSWDQASREAIRQGGYLATLTTPAENDFVFGLSNHPQYWWGGGEFGPLIGGYQPQSSSEPLGGWTWVTGEPWTFENWQSGQPDNAAQEDGLHFWKGSRWNDCPTNLVAYYSYIIEREGPCTPRKAKAVAQLVNGFIVGATVTDPGCGYTNPPAVLIQGGNGSGALARAVISNGEVTEIQILDAGFGYTSQPRIVIGSPPFVPTVNIAVSRINVTQNVVLGWKYVLETSTNAVEWASTGPAFVAESESIVTEFEVDAVGRLFRLRVVP